MIKLEQESIDYIDEVTTFINSDKFEDLIYNKTPRSYYTPAFVWNTNTKEIDFDDRQYSKDYYLRIAFQNTNSFDKKVSQGLEALRKEFIKKFKKAYSDSTKILMLKDIAFEDILSFKVPSDMVTVDSIFNVRNTHRVYSTEQLLVISEVRDNFGDSLPYVIGRYANECRPYGLHSFTKYFSDELVLDAHQSYLDMVKESDLDKDPFYANSYMASEDLLVLRDKLGVQLRNHIQHNLFDGNTLESNAIDKLELNDKLVSERAFLVNTPRKIESLLQSVEDPTIVLDISPARLVDSLEYSKNKWQILDNLNNVYVTKKLKEELPLLLTYVKTALKLNLYKLYQSSLDDLQKMDTLAVIDSHKYDNGIEVV